MSVIFVAIAIILFALVLIIWQPRGLKPEISALGGALLALITGVVTPSDILTLGITLSNTFVTLISLILITLLLQDVGFGEWLAFTITRWGFGRGHVLFFLTLLVGALGAIVVTNISIAIVWTSLLIELLLILGFADEAIMAVILATNFLASATSLLLPVSNCVSLVSVNYLKISGWRYIWVMAPVTLIATVTSLGVLWFYFQKHIPPTYNRAAVEPTNPYPSNLWRCRWHFAFLGILTVSYGIAFLTWLPVSWVTVTCAFVMVGLAVGWFPKREQSRLLSIRSILRRIPWDAIALTMGMSIMAVGLANAGLTTLLQYTLTALSHWGLTLAVTGTGFLSAFLSGLLTSVPTILLNIFVLQNATELEPILREAMVYAAIIGSHFGAKLIPFSGLSMLLGIEVLERRGLKISRSKYGGIVLVWLLPVLFFSCIGLAIWLPWLVV